MLHRLRKRRNQRKLAGRRLRRVLGAPRPARVRFREARTAPSMRWGCCCSLLGPCVPRPGLCCRWWRQQLLHLQHPRHPARLHSGRTDRRGSGPCHGYSSIYWRRRSSSISSAWRRRQRGRSRSSRDHGHCSHRRRCSRHSRFRTPRRRGWTRQLVDQELGRGARRLVRCCSRQGRHDRIGLSCNCSYTLFSRLHRCFLEGPVLAPAVR